MERFKQAMKAVWLFYRDGFRNMTWGRPLIWLIFLKAFILFAVLRVFFFKPELAGLSDDERSRVVGERIAGTPAASGEVHDPDSYNL